MAKTDVPAVIDGTAQIDVAAIVKAAIEATQGNQTQLAEALTAAMKANSGIRKISIGERQKKGLGGTPFNPTNKKRALQWDFYQDGAPIRERYLHDNEIEMLHQLTPGSYLHKMVTVAERTYGDGRKETWIDRTPGRDVYLKLTGIAPTFHALLVKLVAEAKEQKAAKRAAMRAELANTE